MKISIYILLFIFGFLPYNEVDAQNPLAIPPTLSGTTFQYE